MSYTGHVTMQVKLCIPRTNVLPRIFSPCQYLSLSLSLLWWLKCQVTCPPHTVHYTYTGIMRRKFSKSKHFLFSPTHITTNFVTNYAVLSLIIEHVYRCTNALRSALTRISGPVRNQSRGGNLLYIDRMQMEK